MWSLPSPEGYYDVPPESQGSCGIEVHCLSECGHCLSYRVCIGTMVSFCSKEVGKHLLFPF